MVHGKCGQCQWRAGSCLILYDMQTVWVNCGIEVSDRFKSSFQNTMNYISFSEILSKSIHGERQLGMNRRQAKTNSKSRLNVFWCQ